MNWKSVADYQEMSEYAAELIFRDVYEAMQQGRRYNLGLATGNTMITLYKLLADKLNAANCDLSNLHTWNLDEYVDDNGEALKESHPLSYRRYMKTNFFDHLAPERNFTSAQYHFPDPADPEGFDQALADSGDLDFQLLGLGFNGHIAFNEPMPESEISAADFAALPTRVIKLEELTIATNRRLTAGGEDIVPRKAATMGMKQILQAKKLLLLTCFPEQLKPLQDIRNGKRGPELPASYLADMPNAEFVWTADTIKL